MIIDELICEILNELKDKNNHCYIIENLLKSYTIDKINEIISELKLKYNEKSILVKEYLNSNLDFIIDCSKIVKQLKNIQENQLNNFSKIKDKVNNIRKLEVKNNYNLNEYISKYKINKYIYNSIVNNYEKPELIIISLLKILIEYFYSSIINNYSKEEIINHIDSIIKIFDNIDIKGYFLNIINKKYNLNFDLKLDKLSIDIIILNILLIDICNFNFKKIFILVNNTNIPSNYYDIIKDNYIILENNYFINIPKETKEYEYFNKLIDYYLTKKSLENIDNIKILFSDNKIFNIKNQEELDNCIKKFNNLNIICNDQLNVYINNNLDFNNILDNKEVDIIINLLIFIFIISPNININLKIKSIDQILYLNYINNNEFIYKNKLYIDKIINLFEESDIKNILNNNLSNYDYYLKLYYNYNNLFETFNIKQSAFTEIVINF